MKPAFCTQQPQSRGAAAGEPIRWMSFRACTTTAATTRPLTGTEAACGSVMHRTCCRGVQSRARRLRFTAKPAPVPAQRRASTCVRSRIPLQAAHPALPGNYGAIGTIGRDKQVTFSIPVDAVQGLADGYYGGLCLYETPYNFGSSTYSNAYMRMSGTDTNYEPYIECVFSGSTAVG